MNLSRNHYVMVLSCGITPCLVADGHSADENGNLNLYLDGKQIAWFSASELRAWYVATPEGE